MISDGFSWVILIGGKLVNAQSVLLRKSLELLDSKGEMELCHAVNVVPVERVSLLEARVRSFTPVVCIPVNDPEWS